MPRVAGRRLGAFAIARPAPHPEVLVRLGPEQADAVAIAQQHRKQQLQAQLRRVGRRRRRRRAGHGARGPGGGRWRGGGAWVRRAAGGADGAHQLQQRLLRVRWRGAGPCDPASGCFTALKHTP